MPRIQTHTHTRTHTHTHTHTASLLIAVSYWRGGNVAGQRLPIVTFPLGDETANWTWDLLSAAVSSNGFG